MIFDPFAGSGTTLWAAAAAGFASVGVEILPPACAIVAAKQSALRVNIGEYRAALESLQGFAKSDSSGDRFPHIRITQGAFPTETEMEIGRYLAYLKTLECGPVYNLFKFAGMSVLENVSFTRKDGQYLRWDQRADRKLRSRFDKGHVSDFWATVIGLLTTMLFDILAQRRPPPIEGRGFAEATQFDLKCGSCLEILPHMEAGCVDLVVTSPPYCNRYDYTRTYALELAYLGYGEDEVRQLRQALLSATVENKSKRALIRRAYEENDRSLPFIDCERVFAEQAALHESLSALFAAGDRGELNNENIPRMVEQYFFEMNVVIMEMARLLRPGGRIIMVNDNVRYHGEEVPVDIILSSFAESHGLVAERIHVLPRGKGNSSQQMGTFGRSEIRKCLYVWRKPGTDQLG